LSAKGYNVVGVSKDSVASHKKFADKDELPFTLLSDTSTQMLQDFGAWGEKKMCGKVSVGTLRRTFIFNEEGVLDKIFLFGQFFKSPVDVAHHGDGRNDLFVVEFKTELQGLREHRMLRSERYKHTHFSPSFS
jgi:hypothetical protein